jgi:2-oxoisovalerate dehydrogenase E2 component (dihydrolipoyl transacylase)
MSRFVFKMPDLGEGTVEAELVALHVAPGDEVTEDQVMAEIMTEKAAVEVSSPVTGRVVAIHASPGDRVAVGAELIVFDTGAGEAAAEAAPAEALVHVTQEPGASGGGSAREAVKSERAEASSTGRVMASPATRRRARDAGIDLRAVQGSGPNGRIQRADLDAAIERAAGGAAASSSAQSPSTEEIKVIGLRRVIAERMTEAKRTIPHFAYVEEVDVTELEALRAHLNAQGGAGAPFTYLPFLVAALARVLQAFPQCNAHYDAARGVIVRHRAVHVGVATQGPDGLVVPVLRHAERRTVREVSGEIRRLSEAVRAKKATREELSGSTITVTSLGKLGGIVSTPVINAPEVAIIGVNRAVERPVVLNGAITVRRMMNLSSSFDHRFVDGYDAAAMIQALKERLEHPATIFIPD